MQEIFFDINLFSNIYLIAISIIVQFIIYPSFKKYSFVEFKTFHSDYTKKMFLIVGPVMTVELLCCVFLLIENSTLFGSFQNKKLTTNKKITTNKCP